MILASIKLRNFRIHENVELKFAENLNYIVEATDKAKPLSSNPFIICVLLRALTLNQMAR